MKKLLFIVAGLVLAIAGPRTVYGQIPQKEQKQFESFKQKIMLQRQRESHPRLFQEQQQSKALKSAKATIASNYGPKIPLNWAEEFGGTSDDYGNSVVSDNQGNTYVGGYFSGKISLGSQSFETSNAGSGFIAKFDATGNLLWFTPLAAVKDSKSEIISICTGADSNIYATGYYTGGLTIGDFQLKNHTPLNPLLIKLAPSGHVLLAKTFNGKSAGDAEMGKKIALDAQGNIYVISSANGGLTTPSVISKFNASGILLWQQFHSQNFCDMVIAGDNIYYAGVNTRTNEPLDTNVTLPKPNQYDIFYAKASLGGVFQWGKMFTHSQTWYSSSSPNIVVNNGSLYLTGYSYGYISIDTITLNSSFQSDFLIKADTANGQALWGEEIPGNSTYPTGIAVDNGGNIYISKDYSLEKYGNDGSFKYSKPLSYSGLYSISSDTAGNILTTGTFREHIKAALVDTTGNEIWQASFDGNAARGEVLGLATDNTGNVYAYAYVSNPIDFKGYHIGRGMFLFKQNKKGDIVWLKQFPGSYNIAYNDKGGDVITVDTVHHIFYITGAVQGGYLNIPDGPSIAHAFLLKFDLSGRFVWAKQENISNGWYQFDLAIDLSGDILWSGIFSDALQIETRQLVSAGYTDVFVAKFHPDGKFLWAERAGGENYEWNGLITTNSKGEIYLSGEFNSQHITVGQTAITLNEVNGNILLAKLDKNGKVLWIKSKAGSTDGDWYSQPTGFKAGPEGSLYMKGWYGKSAKFDTITLTSPYPYNYFVAKFDTSGNTTWAKPIREHNYGLDYNQFDIDQQGNIYLGAQARDTIAFGSDFTYANRSIQDLFVASYSPQGTLNWVKTFPGSAWMSGVAVSGSDLYVGGYYSGEISFDNKALKYNQRHGFLSKFSVKTQHFTKVWSGNPYQPMAILVKNANLFGDSLQPYDEIGVFTKDSRDNEICVGDGKVTTPVGGKTPLNITVSADDPATTAWDGFRNGDTIYYKIWSNGKQKEFSHVAALYNKDYDTLFHTLGTAIVRLYGYGHYQPAWSGNPYQPMNVLIDSITLPAGTTLQQGDEVGLFDTDTSGNDICVGAGIVSGSVSPQHPLSIVASSDDPITPEIDGFTAHHGIVFKVWSADSIEYTNFSLKYNPAFDSLYTPLGTALVGLSYINTLNQKIPLSKGWNMMSLYVTPDSLGMLKVLKPLVSSGSLVKAIDEKGGFVQNIPGVGWMNTIGDMANTEGYYIKVSKNDTLKSTGLPVDLPFSIPLQTGWNIMGYPVQSGQDAMKVLKTLMDSSRLVKVINEAGGFIQNIPGVGWMNTIGNFEPGEGYYIKVNRNTQITFNKPVKSALTSASGNVAYVMPASKYFNKTFKGNPYYPMNIVVTNIDLDGLEVHAGDEVAAFDKDVCVGVGVVPKDTDRPVNIVASLDDPSTKQTDGFVPGDDITLRYMSPELGSPVTVTSTTLSGESVFTPLETRVCGIAASAENVESHLKNVQNAFRAYPNPTSSSVTFLLGNKESAQVEIELTDLNGKIVRVFCNKTLPAGTHTLHYDLSGLPAGIYNIRVLRRSGKNTSLNNYKLVITR